MKKAVSLTINTIVLIVLAVSVFIIAAVMLFSASKGGSSILSASQFYVKDSYALDRAKKQCKMLCEWAKASNDFIHSKYCNYQISLKVVDVNTGKEEEKLFYCWQKPISVDCESLNEYAGQYIIYNFVDYKENRCKTVKIDSYKLIEIADSIARHIVFHNVATAFYKDVTNEKDFVEWLYYEGYLNLETGKQYYICEGDHQIDTVKTKDKKKIKEDILELCKSNGNPVYLPEYSLAQLAEKWFAISCDTIDNPTVFNFAIKQGDCNGNSVQPINPFNRDGNAFGTKLFTVRITLSGTYSLCTGATKTLYYPIFAEQFVDGDLLRVIESNSQIRNLVAERVKYIVCDQLKQYIP